MVLLLVAAITTFFVVRAARDFSSAITTLQKSGNENYTALVPELLGFNQPRTWLLLFLNNDELRPGGGFIGSYGLASVARGRINSLSINGSENLDGAAPTSFVVAAPAPLKTYLAQPRWFFRDANWSPDFKNSAQNVLRFYSAERGEGADQINTVVGLTPAVIETLLKYTGPITVDGTTYTAETITDLVEYEVEIKYLDLAIDPLARKKVLQKIAESIMEKMRGLPPTQWPNILQDFFGLLEHGQLMIYDVNSGVQKTIEEQGWGGRLRPGTPDYFMFVDANLAGLKTDRVMNRDVRYEILATPSGEWQAKITARYKNSGGFDWRTTRYRTYTRWFFPAGTEFISGVGAMQNDRNSKPGDWSVVNEEDKVSVGAFLAVEPGKTHEISFVVRLAPAVAAALQKGEYGLLVQKQLGLPNFNLTINHIFGKTLKSATPAEASNNFGDQAYTWSGEINSNQSFAAQF